MPNENLGKVISLIVAADYSVTGQNLFVKLDATGKAIKCSVKGAIGVVGVLMNGPKSGQEGSIQTDGIALVNANGAIAAGDPIENDATGAAITNVTGGDYTVGYALEAGVAGQRISVFLKSFGKL